MTADEPVQPGHGSDPEAEQRGERGETVLGQLDRHWAELLQELRVVQTGVQVLTGFLLTLPFQQRFADAPTWQVALYLLAVSLSVLATALFAAPVSAHRALFRRRARRELVEVGHRCAVAGLAALAAAVTCVLALVVAVLLGPLAGGVAGALAAVLFAGLWAGLPVVLLRRARRARAGGGPEVTPGGC